MGPGETFQADKMASPNLLKLFFEGQILSYLPEWEKNSVAMPEGVKFGREMAQEEYDKFVKYDPSTDRGRSFSTSMLLPFWIVSHSDDNQSFENMKELFIQKARVLAEMLYRDAFFRNSYESLDAWRSCARYKERQALFTSLNVLPKGAAEHVASMSKKLDDVWSQKEVEDAFRKAAGDELVEAGVGENSSLVQIYRKGSEPMTEAEYNSAHGLRPDLFEDTEDTYEGYLKKENERQHPYRLKL